MKKLVLFENGEVISVIMNTEHNRNDHPDYVEVDDTDALYLAFVDKLKNME